MSETSAERMLWLIKTLNQNGPCTVVHLQRQTKISRPAIYRLLGVLVRYGYAARAPDQAQFQLTPSVQELCDYVRDDDRVAAAAAPILKQLQRAIVWPTSLAVFDRGAMVIKSTTRSSSPLVFDRARVGERVPLIDTAMGAAYLAFSSIAFRRTILKMLSNSDDPRDRLARDPRKLRMVLRETAKRGYAIRKGGTIPNTTSIAVPLMSRGYAAGSIVVSFLSSALPVEEAETAFVGRLQNAAKDIEHRLEVGSARRRPRRATKTSRT